MIGYKLMDPNAKAPRKATNGACGFDLTAVSMRYHRPHIVEYDTGVAIIVPEDCVGLIYPRSSISNTDLELCNGVGVLDNDYTGTLKLRFRVTGDKIYKVGERIGQILFYPVLSRDDDLVPIEELLETDRGDGGFGSSGEGGLQ